MTNDRELKAEAYKLASGKQIHSNDCATSVAPAEEPGPCDCEVPTEPHSAGGRATARPNTRRGIAEKTAKSVGAAPDSQPAKGAK